MYPFHIILVQRVYFYEEQYSSTKLKEIIVPSKTREFSQKMFALTLLNSANQKRVSQTFFFDNNESLTKTKLQP